MLKNLVYTLIVLYICGVFNNKHVNNNNMKTSQKITAAIFTLIGLVLITNQLINNFSFNL